MKGIEGKNLIYRGLNIQVKDNEKLQFVIFRKESYTDIIIPQESYYSYRYKMSAINSLWYRTQKGLTDTEIKGREVKDIKRVVNNKKYNTNIVYKLIENINRKKAEGKTIQYSRIIWEHWYT